MTLVPEPEVRSRRLSTDELPTRSAKSLVSHGIAAGWHVRSTYARGFYENHLGVLVGPVESVLIRLKKPGRYAEAEWVNGKPHTFRYAGEGVLPPLRWLQVPSEHHQGGQVTPCESCGYFNDLGPTFHVCGECADEAVDRGASIISTPLKCRPQLETLPIEGLA